LAIIAFVLDILQVLALIVTLPVIVYVWASGQYSNAAAIMHTIILLLIGLVDNVLKPLMLGRGVDVPMPVILLGALSGRQVAEFLECLSARWCWRSDTSSPQIGLRRIPILRQRDKELDKINASLLLRS
jgi:hypothetical protein